MITQMPRHILLVGGTGHLGERVALRLARQGIRVRVLTRDPEGSVAAGLKANGCEVVEGDCHRRWRLWDAMEGCDAVVSCAHIRHAEALVQACNRFRIERLICMSSMRRFSRVQDKTVSEVLAGETAIVESELQWTILRPTMIFGGERDKNFSRMIQWIQRHNWAPLFGGGRHQVQPVFVEDVVTVLQESLRQTNSGKHDYSLAGADAMEFRELLRTLARELDKPVRLVPIPLGLGMFAARKFEGLTSRYGVTPASIERQTEDKTADYSPAARDLHFEPRPFLDALRLKLSGHAEVDAMYRSGSGVVQMTEEL